MRPHESLIAALAAALVLAGCSQGGDGGRAAHAPSARTPSSHDAAHAPPRRHPSKAPGPLPAAADGSDTAACGDGSCEVEIHSGTRLRTGADPATLTFSAVGGGQVTVKSAGPGSSLEASTAGGGVIQLNSVKVTVRGVRGHRAVVRVTTG